MELIMETALSQFSVLPSTRQQRTEFVEKAVNEILSGNIDPLKADAILKGAEDTIGEIRKNNRVKLAVQESADKYHEKTFEAFGYTITKSSRSTYDYKGIDPVLDDLYGQMEKLKETIKAREATVKSGLDPATGETFSPVKFTTTEILSYKLK